MPSRALRLPRSRRRIDSSLEEALATSARELAGAGGLAAHPRAFRIVKRHERGSRRDLGRGQLDLVAAGPDVIVAAAARMRYIAERDRRAQGVAVHPGGDETDALPIAVDRLVVIDERLGGLQEKLHQAPLRHACRALREKGFAADEPVRLLDITREDKTCFPRRVGRSDVV